MHDDDCNCTQDSCISTQLFCTSRRSHKQQLSTKTHCVLCNGMSLCDLCQNTAVKGGPFKCIILTHGGLHWASYCSSIACVYTWKGEFHSVCICTGIIQTLLASLLCKLTTVPMPLSLRTSIPSLRDFWYSMSSKSTCMLADKSCDLTWQNHLKFEAQHLPG